MVIEFSRQIAVLKLMRFWSYYWIELLGLHKYAGLVIMRYVYWYPWGFPVLILLLIFVKVSSREEGDSFQLQDDLAGGALLSIQ